MCGSGGPLSDGDGEYGKYKEGAMPAHGVEKGGILFIFLYFFFSFGRRPLVFVESNTHAFTGGQWNKRVYSLLFSLCSYIT